MKKIFMLQNPSNNYDKFIEDVSTLTGIPKTFLKQFKDQNQIMINEHYFKNIYENLFKKDYPDYESFVDLLINGMSSDECKKLEKSCQDKIEVFGYILFD